ncbi:MAG TPA: PQQ-dependent sugar dehydrogenase, partial [Longimicrobiales bacterium]|nr:PQQ-dependent sugar dehydrogenase [Longimicrobiales bacterium]
MNRSAMTIAAAGAILTACGVSVVDPPLPAPPTELRVETVVTGLVSPVHLAAPPGDARLFVVEQPGRIRLVENGQLSAQPFLDIVTSVRSGGEQGLLGLAFHPQFEVNGFLYVNYTDLAGTTRIVRFTASADRSRGEPSSATEILHVPQPFANHNGGTLAFGPDGMLYIGMGDGGGGGDPLGHGQNPGTFLGALLRIDVDGGHPYAIPPDNPFAGDPDARPEVWAVGLRNPWRFAFDPAGGMLYIADVGQNRREEVNVQPAAAAGLNYGWNIMEGSLCHPAGSTCSPGGLVLPAV